VALANDCLEAHFEECTQQGHCVFTSDPAPVASTFESARAASGLWLACLRTSPSNPGQTSSTRARSRVHLSLLSQKSRDCVCDR
jgi:hypothetical protein